MKKTLMVLFGGYSSEYGVSLQSAAAVMRAVDQSRYELVRVGITRMGQWLLYGGPEEDIEADTWTRHPSCLPAILSPSREDHGLWLMRPEGSALKTVDLCFPVLHGRGGEDGAVQGLLELAGIPIVGCGSAASAVCMDKEVAHKLALQDGIACPRFVAVQYGSGCGQAVNAVLEGLREVPFPWFVKPAREGSSYGVSRVEAVEQLPRALELAGRYDDKVVVEEGMDGFEVGCAILGGAQPLTGAVDAISLKGGLFDYHEKYTLETAEILLPAPVDAATEREIKKTALRLYRLFGCAGLARVDLFCTTDGSLVFNEVNTIPGMTAHSRYPGMLREAGIPFEQMVAQLLEQAVAA